MPRAMSPFYHRIQAESHLTGRGLQFQAQSFSVVIETNRVIAS